MSSFSWLLTKIIMVTMLYLDSSLSYNFSETVIVDKYGKGQFKTIQDAINFVPKGNNKWFHIIVNPGVYREKVTIELTKDYIFLEGSRLLTTKIIWGEDQSNRLPHTFTLYASDFVAKNIIFMNSYNKEDKTNKTATTSAAAIFGDRVAFYNCSFLGFKWTLYDRWGRHYYNSCYIEGASDFIWGEGTSIFEGCKINTTSSQLNGRRHITAQGRKESKDMNGFVFKRSSVVGIGKVFLGRAYGPFSRVIFSEMTFSSVVHPLGWDAGDFVGKEGSLTNVEADCKGPGAETSQRAKWTKIKRAHSCYLLQFSVKKFIDQDGWIAKTSFG